MQVRYARNSVYKSTMPKYETNQQVVGFIRRLAGEFQGFNTQTVPMSGEMIQMLHGQIVYQGARTFIALFSKPGNKHDTMVLSLPLFHLPERRRSLCCSDC